VRNVGHSSLPCTQKALRLYAPLYEFRDVSFGRKICGSREWNIGISFSTLVSSKLLLDDVPEGLAGRVLAGCTGLRD
jgi:hypothetical protein